jgi:hypothetical protein
MELLPGSLPDLVRQIRPFSLSMTSMRKLAMQLLVSLSFLSSQGIIHADIRAENVSRCFASPSLLVFCCVFLTRNKCDLRLAFNRCWFARIWRASVAAGENLRSR